MVSFHFSYPYSSKLLFHVRYLDAIFSTYLKTSDNTLHPLRFFSVLKFCCVIQAASNGVSELLSSVHY